MQKPVKPINVKVIFIIIIILLILLAGYGYFLKYLPKQNKDIKIIEYKKDFYKSILCEYSCPLKSQEYKNKTRLLPEIECVKDCTENFKQKNNHTIFSSVELNQDNLIKDIDAVIKECKKQSLNTTSFSLNDSLLFSCSSQRLAELGKRYDYLG
jgi:hypothetical protein